MTEPIWIRVWLQGGDADGYQYETLIEPGPILYFIPDKSQGGGWIRVSSTWAGALPYERVPSVEQFDHERIYYPLGAA